ncbi:MAG: oxygen-independent coproporphyrinogen III oxidase [Elusimicrobia bacterium]|nr:MAG: oxygen-independent coproporphyrinogen III oxidase [Elusimicrobiota bacterium]KAF0155347.1 MAG: oxygen-independent coproporphyrinogen III oxidase [Elusimicrobiota bacterium]
MREKDWLPLLRLIESGQSREGSAPYPPVAAWGPVRDDAPRRAWSRVFSERAEFEVYAHIPFCRSVCFFCNTGARRVASCADREAYLRALLREIDIYGAMKPRRCPSRLFIGGGTPNLLSPRQLSELLGALREGLGAAPDAETVMEVNPDFLDDPRLKALKDGGVGVLSLGLESLDQRLVDSLGRTQTVRAVSRAYMRSRRAGFRRIIVDMIAGLPGQSERAFLRDLSVAASWRPDEICMERFSPERTAFEKCGGRLSAADRARSGLLIEAGFRLLRSMGYHHRNNEPFASLRPGEQGGRPFSSRFDGRSILGLGLGSLSHIWGRWRSRNTLSEKEYAAAAASGRLPAASGIVLRPRDEKVNYVLDSLSSGWLDRSEYKRLFGRPPELDFGSALSELVGKGRLLKKGREYAVVRPDRADLECAPLFYSRSVIRRLVDASGPRRDALWKK